jgi:hypothetical protein
MDAKISRNARSFVRKMTVLSLHRQLQREPAPRRRLRNARRRSLGLLKVTLAQSGFVLKVALGS